MHDNRMNRVEPIDSTRLFSLFSEWMDIIRTRFAR